MGGATIATSIAIGAGVMAAVGSYQQGQQQQQLYDYQAKVDEANAVAQRNWGEYNAQQTREKGMRIKASQEAQLAANGWVTTEGSPLALLVDTATQVEMDAQADLHKAEMAARASEMDAAGSRYAGDLAYQGGVMKAGTSLLMAGYSAYEGGVFNSSSGVNNVAASRASNPNWNSSTGSYVIDSPNANIPSRGDLY